MLLGRGIVDGRPTVTLPLVSILSLSLDVQSGDWRRNIFLLWLYTQSPHGRRKQATDMPATAKIRPSSGLTVLSDQEFDAKLREHCRRKPKGNPWPAAEDVRPCLLRGSIASPSSASLGTQKHREEVHVVDDDESDRNEVVAAPPKAAVVAVPVQRQSSKREREEGVPLMRRAMGKSS